MISVKLAVFFLSYVCPSIQVTFALFDTQLQPNQYCVSTDWDVKGFSDPNQVKQGYCLSDAVTVFGKSASCDKIGKFLGPLDPAINLARSYTGLPTHDKVRITYTFVKLYDFESTGLLTLDGDLNNIVEISYSTQFDSTKFTMANPVSAANDCKIGVDLSKVDASVDLTFEQAHTTATLQVEIATDVLSTQGAWGIRNYKLYLQVNCNYECNACSDSDPAQCTTCAANRAVTPTCSCPDGTYNDGSNPECGTCPGKCSTCQKEVDNSIKCTKCAQNRSNSPNCDCSDGFFAEGDNCTQCKAICSSCTTSADNCTACVAGREKQPACTCAGNTYDDGVSTTCLSCSYRCSGCSESPTKCTSCAANRGVGPSCDCLPKFFDDGSTPGCQACSFKCDACTAISTCVSCATDSNRQSAPQCSCPDGYLEVANNAVCTKCSYKCAKCAGTINACTTCPNGRTTTGCICGDGTFDDGTNQTCAACSQKCVKCSGSADNCTSCANGSTNLPSCGCGSNTFVDGVSPQCQVCSYKCATCSNQASNCGTCAANRSGSGCSCPVGYFETPNQAECSKCSFRCATCSDSAPSCTSCAATRSKLPECTECPIGYFDDGTDGGCAKCDTSKCSQCTGNPTTCTVCADSSYQAPTCKCRNNQLQQTSNGQLQCLDCDYKCGTCSNNASTCSTCSDTSRGLVPDCACPALTTDIPNQAACKMKYNCHYQCSSCGPDLTCITCADNRVNQPSCNCPSGFRDDGNSPACVSCALADPVAQFSSSFDRVVVTFAVKIELSVAPTRGQQFNIQNCNDALSTSFVSTLGTSPQCGIKDTQFTIIFGLEPTLSVGSVLQINAGAINSLGCNGITLGGVTIHPPQESPAPTFNVAFTAQVQKCIPTTITITDITNTGSRPLKSIQYGIISLVPPNVQAQAKLALLFNQLNADQTPQTTILLPGNTLTDSTQYIISVTLTNFVSTSTTKQFTITTLSSLDPSIQLVKSGPYKVYQQIVLQAVISLQSCGTKADISASTVLKIQWTVDDKPLPIQSLQAQTESVAITFDPYKFSVGQLVKVQVSAILPNGKATDQTTIDITPSSLIVNILGGNRRQGRPQELQLQAVVVDPDQKNSIEGIEVEWSCEQAEIGTPCLEPTFKKGQLKQTIPPNTLTALKSYIFYVKASKTTGSTITSASGSAVISVDTNAQSSISVMYPAYLSNQKANLNSEVFFIVQKNIYTNQRRRVLVNDQSSDGQSLLQVKINYDGQQVASFYPSTYVVPIVLQQHLAGHFKPGVEQVTILFTYTDPALEGKTLETSSTLQFNLPPQSGTLKSSPVKGMALSQKFQIQMQGWKDQDTPITYKFGYYSNQKLYEQDMGANSQAGMTILSDWSNNNFIETIFPQGTLNEASGKYEIIIVALISDALGGQVISSQTIEVVPYSRKGSRRLQSISSYEEYLKTLPESDYSRYTHLRKLLERENLTLSERLERKGFVQIASSRRILAETPNLADSIFILSSIVKKAQTAKVIDGQIIQQLIQATQHIVQIQSGGCKTDCSGNGNCVSDKCQCKVGFYLENCLATESEYDEVLRVASQILELIGTIKKTVKLQQSSEDQLMRSLNILMRDKNITRVQSSSQISGTLENAKAGFSKNFESYQSNGGSSSKTVDSLITTVPDPDQDKRLGSIQSTISSTTDVTDKIFTATAGDNKDAFKSRRDQDAMNKDLIGMSKNATSFFATGQFPDQPPKAYRGSNMGINAQKVSKEASMKYFATTTYLYAGSLSEVELAELSQSTLSGEGDMEMSTVSYDTNPYNSDKKFPYPNQTNQMVSPNYKDQSGKSVTPKKPILYQLKAAPPPKSGETDPVSNVCVTEQEGTWTNAGCSTLTAGSDITDQAPSLGDEDESDESDESGQSCNCEVSTEITIVSDLTGMFANSNIDALWNPDLLANFEFWNSAIFYIALVITIIWFVLCLWGWRKDKADILKLETTKLEKAAVKAKAEEEKHQADQKIEIQEKNAGFLKEPVHPPAKTVNADEYDSDEDVQLDNGKKRSVLKQFSYSLPMVHEFLSIFSQYSEEEPRPVRFTIYYLKMIIMMALTSIFGESLNATQNVVFSLICVALMNPIVVALNKGFAPGAPRWKKFGALAVVLSTFAGSWYICLVVAAKMGIDASNVWVVSYTISLLINIIIMETMTIFIQILATPYIKTHIDSGNLMIRILYFYLFQESISNIVDTVV